MADEAGTHLAILLKCFELGDGPILEMGTGQFSTPILDMMCKRRQKRWILSLENDPEWYAINKAKYESDYHKFMFVQDWDAPPIMETHWGLVLIDHKPALRRKTDIVRLKHRAHYILCHDSEPEIERFYRYDRAYPHFKYRYDYEECEPFTTVLSNFSNLGELR